MATVTTSEDVYQNRVRYIYYECNERRHTYANDLKQQTIWKDNTKSSRVRPSEPLWLHPTALVKQSTEVDVRGYIQSSEKTYYGTKTCNGVTTKVYRDVFTSSYTGGTRQGVAPSTNWALKARLRVKDLSVNLAQPLHEYRETAKMFYGAASGIRNAWLQYRSLRRFQLRRPTMCDIPASELMYTYGVAPLVGTLFDSAIQLRDRISNPIYRRFYVKDTATLQVDVKTGIGYVGKWDVSERAIFYVKFLTGDFDDFSLGNPLEVAWETVPFSFVADWVINIGDTLKALDALKGVEALTGTLTRKEKYHHIRPYLPGKFPWRVMPQLFYESHERTVLTTIPMPRLPEWKPSDSYRKIANGLALLWSLNPKCQR